MNEWDVNIYVKSVVEEFFSYESQVGERKENKQPEDKKLKELLDIVEEESAVGKRKLSVSPHEHTRKIYYEEKPCERNLRRAQKYINTCEM